MESNGLSCESHLIGLLGEDDGRQVGLISLPVVKGLDIFGDGLSSLSGCREPAGKPLKLGV